MSEDDPGVGDLYDTLSSILSASTLGYSLSGNPQGFVLAVVYDALISAASNVAGEIGLILLNMWSIFTDATIGTIGGLFRAAGSSIASILIDDVVGGVNDIVVNLAAGAGPLAFVVIPVAWAIVTVFVGLLLVGGWRAYLLVRSAIV